MAKETKIELEIPQGRQSFPVEQADGILRMRFNGGWHLPADSEWTWSAEKGFEKKGKKAASNGSNGSNGANGSNGSNGANGANGSNGSNGSNGANGSNGDNGANGSNGQTAE